MSYIMDTVACVDCGYEMNVAFGVVGTIQMGGWPKDCPKCHGTVKKIRDGWTAKMYEDHLPLFNATHPTPPWCFFRCIRYLIFKPKLSKGGYATTNEPTS